MKQQKVIFDFINCHSGSAYSFLLFVFLGLSLVHTNFNFNLPKTSKIRDAAPFSTVYSPLEKLSLSGSAGNSKISAVPRTATAVFNQPAATFAARYAAVSGSSLFRISNPAPVADPSVDAGYGVKRYGAKFLYGHSSLAFSRLKSLNVGDQFIVEMDGQVATYRVSRREVMSKSSLDANSGLRSAIYGAQYRGKSYDLSLMTCGNGANDDANYRLILFAARV